MTHQIPVTVVEEQLRNILARPEMFVPDAITLAIVFDTLYSLVAQYRFQQTWIDYKREWEYLVRHNSTGNLYFNKIDKTQTNMMKAILETFIREQYHKHGEVWISQ